MNETMVRPAAGKLGIMCVGLGAVTTTTIVGTLMGRKQLAKPIGSFACDGIMRLGKGRVYSNEAGLVLGKVLPSLSAHSSILNV